MYEVLKQQFIGACTAYKNDYVYFPNQHTKIADFIISIVTSIDKGKHFSYLTHTEQTTCKTLFLEILLEALRQFLDTQNSKNFKARLSAFIDDKNIITALKVDHANTVNAVVNLFKLLPEPHKRDSHQEKIVALIVPHVARYHAEEHSLIRKISGEVFSFIFKQLYSLQDSSSFSKTCSTTHFFLY